MHKDIREIEAEEREKALPYYALILVLCTLAASVAGESKLQEVRQQWETPISWEVYNRDN